MSVPAWKKRILAARNEAHASLVIMPKYRKRIRRGDTIIARALIKLATTLANFDLGVKP